MTVRGIDHINIGTARIADTIAFFRDVIGLTEGWRPDFPFPGAWLYAGETAVVHLVDLTDAKRPSGEAALDHFALRIVDYDDIERRLVAHNVPFQRFAVPGTTIRQLVVQDPNGVYVELNYKGPPSEQAGA